MSSPAVIFNVQNSTHNAWSASKSLLIPFKQTWKLVNTWRGFGQPKSQCFSADHAWKCKSSLRVNLKPRNMWETPTSKHYQRLSGHSCWNQIEILLFETGQLGGSICISSKFELLYSSRVTWCDISKVSKTPLTYSMTSGPIDWTPGINGSDKNILKQKVISWELFTPWWDVVGKGLGPEKFSWKD